MRRRILKIAVGVFLVVLMAISAFLMVQSIASRSRAEAYIQITKEAMSYPQEIYAVIENNLSNSRIFSLASILTLISGVALIIAAYKKKIIPLLLITLMLSSYAFGFVEK